MFLMSACVTMSGNYVISAYDTQGKLLTGNLQLTAMGSRIDSVRNGICSAYPKATVVIKNSVTGEELQGESPYQCR